MSIAKHESNKDIKVTDRNCIEFKGKMSKNILPKDIKIHCKPNDWSDLAPSVDKNISPFDEIDNLGGWSSYSFCPVLKKKNGASIHKHRCLPIGYIPVKKR